MKKIVFLALLLCFNFKLFSYTYYLPHIHTGSDAWETYLIMDNASDETLRCFVYFWGDNGQRIDYEIYEITPHETKKVSLREKGAAWLYIYAGDKRLSFRVGYVAKESLGGGTAEFSLPKKLLKTAMFRLSNYYDELTWSGFALTNGLYEEVNVKPYIYTDTGVIEGQQFTMGPYEKIVSMFGDFFGIDYSEIKFVVFEADKTALQGVVISGKENDKLLFTAPLDASSDWASGWGLFYDYGGVGAIIPKNYDLAVFYTYNLYDNEGNWLLRNVSYDGMKYIVAGRKIVGVRIQGGFTEYDSKVHSFVYGITLQGKYFIHKWETNYTDAFHIEPDSCPYSLPYGKKIVAASSESVFGVVYKKSDGKVAIKFYSNEDGSELASYVSDKTGYAGFIFFDGSNFYAGYTYDNGNGVNDYLAVLKFDSAGQNKNVILDGRFSDTLSQSKNNYFLDAAVYNNFLHILTATAITSATNVEGEVVQVDSFSLNLSAPSLSNFVRDYVRFFDYTGATGKILVPSENNSSENFYVILSYGDGLKGSMIYSMVYSEQGNFTYEVSRAVPYSIKDAAVIPSVLSDKTLLNDQDSCVFLCETPDISGETDGVTGIKFYKECIVVKSPFSEIMNVFTPNLFSHYR